MSDRQTRVYEILEKLVAFPTMAGKTTALNDCLDYAQNLLTAAGLQTVRHKSNGLPSLVASSKPSKTFKIILQAHLDVVPCDDDLLSMRRQKGRLIGRGCYDMKFAAACFLAAAEALQAQNSDLDYAIILTTDEEIGGYHGVKYLVQQQDYTADICLLPDGADDWAIEEQAKSAWFIQASACGRAAHGSRPWEGNNAAHKLIDFLQSTRNLFPNVSVDEPTVVISQLSGGVVMNQVPEKAQATFDIRMLDASAHEEVVAQLLELANIHDVALASLDFSGAASLDVSLPQVKNWETIATKVVGRTQLAHTLSYGASDARYFSAAGTPTIVTRPLGGCAHGAEEWVDEQDLYRFCDAIIEFVQTSAND